jgi:WD40 repeat protein
VAVTLDGWTLATANRDIIIKSWYFGTQKDLRTLERHQVPVNSLKFAPDGKTLASASYDATVKLWHAAGNKEAETACPRLA